MGIFLKPGINGAGYLFVMVSTYNGPKPIQIHRIEMIKFKPIENYFLLDVNHKDGIKTHNKLNNLEWCTRQQNIIHAYQNNLAKCNQYSCKTVLTNDEVYNICVLLSKNIYTIKEISEMTNISTSIIAGIKKRNSWVNISKDFNFYSRQGRLFTDEMVEDLCKYFQNNNIGNNNVNLHCKNALLYYGYDSSERMIDSARKIYNRKYYTNISSKYIF